MAKKKDLKSLGDVYSNLGEEAAVVAESKDNGTVGDEKASIGEAELEDGGIPKDAECEDPNEVKVEDSIEQVDPEEDNEGKHTQTSEGLKKKISDALKRGDIGPDDAMDIRQIERKTKEDKDESEEENEESSEKCLEIAKEGLNNFMAKKSVFDQLFDKVMVNENYPEMEEMDDLGALGLDEATPDSELETDDVEGGEEEVTITLDKALAEQLCDILKAACGEEEGDDAGEDDLEMDVEVGGEEAGPEEDNEGAPQAFTTSYNDGKSNKVGNQTGLGGEGKGSADGGKSAHQKAHSAAVKDGKSNKVGSLAAGKSAFGDVKVQPKNKEVKA